VLSMLIRGLAGSILWALVLVVLIICYFRILSRNVYKRRSENEWYLRRKNAVSRWFRSLKDRWNQRKEYRFFRCPSCHTLLRVPKRKGKILLTCRKCGRRFERKT
jgi:DNA-directed RNA polymerase subunit M/transcription elongation factor TFIIS